VTSGPVNAVRPITTTVVGSYPQPEWLIDRARLQERLPPRVRAAELWRVAPELLAQAQDDATIVAIRDLERAGLDVITDGEIRRESYSNHFATALEGIDLERPGEIVERTGSRNSAPRIVGPIKRARPVQVDDVVFLRANTDRSIKITVPGPFTMTQQCEDDYYDDDRALALAFADAVAEEIADLFAAGADIVQVDEPYLQARPEAARRYAVDAINRALAGASGTTALHSCFGYAHFAHGRKGSMSGYPFLEELDGVSVDQVVLEAAEPGLDPALFRGVRHELVLGVIDLGTTRVETPSEVAARIRAALEHVAPERLSVAPDCGMKYLPRDVAFAKLVALVEGAAIVREEL
jgi:5-methyltetrahydropteroyltriglutamate--homocysteine methyltransferase